MSIPSRHATGITCILNACLACGAVAGTAASAGDRCTHEWSAEFAAAPVSGAPATLLVFDDGSGERLYLGGAMVSDGPPSGFAVLSYDGQQFQPVGAALGAPVADLSRYDFGSGQRLIAVGNWGLLPQSQLAQWTGGEWVVGPAGLPASWAASVAPFDGNLFVASPVGGATDTYMVRWNGTAWVPVVPALGSAIHDMLAFDDGTGPALYMAGAPLVQGIPGTGGIARWRDGSMHAVGTGINGQGHALAIFDDGTGPALYVGGNFVTAGATPARFIARWRDGVWSSVGEGFNKEVFALQVWDDGSGPALYAAGRFTQSGNTAVSRIAKWNGASWEPLDGGIAGGDVAALAVYDADGAGPRSSALYAVGSFTSAGGLPSARVARWQRCLSDCPADFDASGSVDGADLGVLLSEWGGPGSADLNGSGAVDGADLGSLLAAWGPCVQ